MIHNVLRILFAPAILLLLFSSYLFSSYAIAKPVVKSVEPATVKYGQAAEITLQFDNLPLGTHVAIALGGPYSVASLAPEESAQAVAITDDHALLATKNKFLLIDYQNDTPTILSSIPYNKNIQNVSISSDTIAIATNTELNSERMAFILAK